MENLKITSHEITEALEQVRAGFTVSRMALGAITILHPLKRKSETWSKKFMKVQKDYHQFLLDSYKELEEELSKKQKEESESPEYSTTSSEEVYNEISKVQ